MFKSHTRRNVFAVRYELGFYIPEDDILGIFVSVRIRAGSRFKRVLCFVLIDISSRTPEGVPNPGWRPLIWAARKRLLLNVGWRTLGYTSLYVGKQLCMPHLWCWSPIWRRCVPPGRLLTFTGLHGLSYQKAELFVATSVRPSIWTILSDKLNSSQLVLQPTENVMFPCLPITTLLAESTLSLQFSANVKLLEVRRSYSVLLGDMIWSPNGSYRVRHDLVDCTILFVQLCTVLVWQAVSRAQENSLYSNSLGIQCSVTHVY
jgi:hypothetical protein